MDDKIRLLVHARSYSRTKVTNAHKDCKNFHELNTHDKLLKKAQIDKLNSELERYNSEIQSLKFSTDFVESDFNQELQRCDHYFDLINECLILLNTPSNNTSSPPKSLLKTPVVPLPSFSGNENEDLLRFLSIFEDTLNKYNLTDSDKLSLLKQQLKGRAKILVDSLEISNQSYVEATNLLKKGLASTSTQIFNVLNQLISMKLTETAEPFEYVSKIRKITETVSQLKITVDNILAFFFWKGLTPELQSNIIQITNKTRPDLKELNESIFEAIERVRLNKNKKKESSKINEFETNTFASKVDVRKDKFNANLIKCSLCTFDNLDNNHPIFKCKVYSDSSVRVNRIKKIGGCIKCGNLKHDTDSCKFKFKKRCNCSDWHYSFLCTNANSQNNQTRPKPKPNQSKDVKPSEINLKSDAKLSSVSDIETDAKIAIVNDLKSVHVTEAFSSLVEDISILPTFTAEFNNSKTVRCFRDIRCQNNFISEKLANELKLNIVHKDVNLNVNGFNGSQRYLTKIVSMKINFGSKIHTINALCIPKINVNLKIPRLSQIAKAFEDKGYVLADKLLSDSNSINDIEFILGTKSAYCLKTNEISFGAKNDSIYAKSDLGILLLGDSNTMLNNVNELPKISVNYDNKVSAEAFSGWTETDMQFSFEAVSDFAFVDKTGEISSLNEIY